MVAFFFQLDNETKVSSINAKKKKKKKQGIYLVLLTKKASEIKEFKFAPNVFPANSMKAGERARLMKSLLHDRALLQADQRLFKHSKVSHVEQSIRNSNRSCINQAQ